MTSTSSPPSPPSPPEPQPVTSAAEFVAQLRALRAWSGMTYRQLQRQAELAGDALPHSTLASALSRDRLPREDLVIAFVRACGCDHETAHAWTEIRRVVAASAEAGRPDPEPTEPVQVEPPAPAPPVPGPPRRLRRILAAAAVLALTLGLGVVIGWELGQPGATRLQTPAAAASTPPHTRPGGAITLAWWDFEKGDATAIPDRTGRGATLSAGHGVQRQRAGDSTALVLNGTGRVRTSGPPLRTDAGFTVTAWLRLDKAGAWSTALSQHDDTFDVFLLGYDQEFNRLGFLTPRETDGWLVGRALAKTPPQRGVWTHLAGVYDATALRLHLYVNGNYVATSQTHALRRAKGPLEVGAAAQYGKAIDPWHGAIDDVRIFDGVLGPDQIRPLAARRT